MNTIKVIVRLLSLNLTREEMLGFDFKHLLTGIIGTWIVGMGRYWDDENASFLQHLGLGSVIYIFLLAFFIWLIILPFKIEKWSYKTVLTFIGLTSFPAILYAIPVERVLDVEIANKMNVLFLATVAIWRLCLLHFFLKKFTRLSTGDITIVSFMPICLIISALTALNLHKVVFQVMGGFRDPTAHDASYMVLIFLSVISVLLSIPLIIGYVIAIIHRRKALSSK